MAKLLTGLPVPAQLWGSRGEVLATNRAFNDLFGYPEGEDWQAAGRSLLTDGQVVASGASVMMGKALVGEPVEIHALTYEPHVSHDSDGPGRMKLFIRLLPIADEDGKTQFVLCTVTDYTAAGDRFERELMRSQKMENVETLAGAVAHEFNNLFTGIRGMTELISDMAEPESEIQLFADAIGTNVTRGAELISKLSGFARELPHSLKRRSIATYLQRVQPLLALHVQKRITIDVDIPVDADVFIDTSRMDQALANICNNARDAMGGVGEMRLALSYASPPGLTCSAGEWVLLEIADNGPGIPEELRGRVLEPFFSTKEKGKATGLGLSMTRRIVGLHDGILHIGGDDRLGGALISIYLPVATGSRVPVPAGPKSQEEPADLPQ